MAEISGWSKLGAARLGASGDALDEQSYLLLDLLELPALLSDVVEKLQSFVILLGHLHPRLLQTSL